MLLSVTLVGWLLRSYPAKGVIAWKPSVLGGVVTSSLHALDKCLRPTAAKISDQYRKR